MQTAHQLIIFYDSHCPMCCAEMENLKRHDNNNAIYLVDLHSNEFVQDFPEIEKSEAMKILHGNYQGRLLLGLEVTYRAWSLVGKGCLVAPLNWPVIKPLANRAYTVLAKYRHPISAFLAKRLGLSPVQCTDGKCNGKTL